MKVKSGSCIKQKFFQTLVVACFVIGPLAVFPALSQEGIATPKAHLPAAEDSLLWPPTVQPYGYSIVDKLFATRAIKHGAHVYPLPRGKELSVSFQFNGKAFSIDDYIEYNNISGLLVIKNGTIVLERYALGFTETATGVRCR